MMDLAVKPPPRRCVEISRRQVPPWSARTSEMAILRFRHSGRDEGSDYLGFCNFAWAQVLQKLKEVCEASP